ncbi:alpha/beta hydrolase [Pedobacter montanisoli]|uniref:Alpha/beta hydrolase n=1 Tax=Pedobacter montanisoli TaxID=2923277 RepID=A0ABS9ZV20_9SPHI|nr:alpha/beta hydrolase [Pedobacter montanisoli]MCJ0742192.1 alpha/beta hydrolase [Pedobacter montanisoli]
MKKIALLILFSVMIGVKAQQRLPLYGAAVPGARPVPANYTEETLTDNNGVLKLSRVSKPELVVYQPAKANGTAVIICPGGGYGFLSIEKEGYAVAKKLNELGITAFVLKYRLPNSAIMQDKTAGPLQDALQAMYLVRKNATIWGVNPEKIGVIGFSAGGHLAANLSVHYRDAKIENSGNISLRPDFTILIYPLISFVLPTHAGSLNNLLGEEPALEQKRYFSAELQVTEQTPPTFLVHANNDATVPVKNSIAYNEALTKKGVPSEMHIYATGGHGFGLGNKNLPDNWFERLTNWLKINKLI